MKRSFLFIAFLSLATLGCRNNVVRSVDAELSIFASISGKITCPSTSTPPTATIKLVLTASSGIERTMRPNANGTFTFNELDRNLDYKLAVTREHDPNLNLSNLNLVQFNEVMLGNRRISTALEFLAADPNRDGEVDPTDALLIRRIALNVVPNNNLWRFASKDWINQTNTATRIGSVGSLTLKNLTGDAVNCDFTMVRIGDVGLTDCF